MQISIQVQQNNGWDHVHYVGPINEEAELHLNGLIAKLGPQVVFNFKKVSMINSCGVRAWINFLRDVEKGRKVIFEECTPEIVMQMNMIPSFKASATVKSVYASYVCESCNNKQMQIFEAGKSLPTTEGAEIAPVKCSKCGTQMEMEELEDEFFAFAIAS